MSYHMQDRASKDYLRNKKLWRGWLLNAAIDALLIGLIIVCTSVYFG